MIPQGNTTPTTTAPAAGAIPRRAANAEEAMARIAAARERTEQMASAAREMTDQLKELRATARDENELAEITVDSGGILVDTRMSEQILRVSPAVTAQAVVEASNAARALMAEMTREVITSTIGSDSAAGKAVLEHMDRRLGDPDTDGGEQ